MKTKDSIYIVKGKEKSALIDLSTQELRAISNVQLGQLADDVNLEVSLSDYIAPNIDAYNKELLDIRLTKDCDAQRDFSFLKDCIQNGAVYQNVRIFCPKETAIALDCVKALLWWVNENIYHFGVIIFISDQYDQAIFQNVFTNYKVMSLNSKLPEEKLYKPIFHSSPQAIFISKTNNLYHYSRDTLMVRGKATEWVNHNRFNIPKSEIENCKDCAFRLTCYDSREVQKTEEKYYYDSTCEYQLDC